MGEPLCPRALKALEDRRRYTILPPVWELFVEQDGAPEDHETGDISLDEMDRLFYDFCALYNIRPTEKQHERAQPIQALRARAQALSSYTAAVARRSHSVEKFRGEWISGLHRDYIAAMRAGQSDEYRGSPYQPWKPLAFDKVQPWVVVRYGRDVPGRDAPAAERYEFWRKAEKSELRYYVPTDETTDDGRTVFAFQRLTVPERSCLGELVKLAKDLAETWEWDEAEAVMFVLTDEEPIVDPINISSRVAWGTDWRKCRMTIVVDPVVTPEELADWYREARRGRLPTKFRLQRTDKHFALGGFWAERGLPEPRSGPEWAAFLQEWSESDPDTRPADPQAEWDRLHPGPPWTAHMAEWNRVHPEWAYENWRHFAKDAKKARERLLFPPYKRD